MTEAAPPKSLDPPIEVLQGLCLEFVASDDLFDAVQSAVRWIHEAVGDEASTRISLVDSAGRLRAVIESENLPRTGSNRSRRRRQAFASGVPVLLEEEGGALAILPLVCRGEAVGVLEVVAPRQVVSEREGILRAVASQLALTVRNLRDRERLQKQIASLTSASARRNHQLDLGLAWTAHEVREPLLAAKAAIDQLVRSNGNLAEDDLLSRSGQELGDLAALVDAVLRWAVGSGPLDVSPMDLVQEVRQAVATCCFGTDGRVDVEAPSALPIQGDAAQLRSAFGNLVRNALAYSPEGTKVNVRVSRAGGTAVVSVADHGPGIPPREREEVFEPFARGPSGRSRPEGRGLGLFIARRVIEAHGGTICVESTNGEGATFRIQLPVSGNGHQAPLFELEKESAPRRRSG